MEGIEWLAKVKHLPQPLVRDRLQVKIKPSASIKLTVMDNIKFKLQVKSQGTSMITVMVNIKFNVLATARSQVRPAQTTSKISTQSHCKTVQRP